jgi:hypothetical protein
VKDAAIIALLILMLWSVAIAAAAGGFFGMVCVLILVFEACSYSRS